MFLDNETLDALLKGASESFAHGARTDSICINMRDVVGWASTDKLNRFKSQDLETFDISHKGYGLRVKLALGATMPASQTNLVTIVYEVKKEGNRLVILSFSSSSTSFKNFLKKAVLLFAIFFAKTVCILFSAINNLL